MSLNLLRDRKRELRLSKKRAYRQRPDVREKQRVYNKAYRLKPENLERDRLRKATPEYREYMSEWRARPASKAKQRLFHAQWRSTPEGRAKFNASSTAYRKNPKHAEVIRARKNACEHRRRARLRDGVSVGVSPKQWEEIKATFGHRCAYCLRAVELQRDHVIPIAAGGRDEYDNVVPACQACNFQKNDQILAVWYGRNGARL